MPFLSCPRLALLDEATAIGLQQLLQIIHLRQELTAAVSVPHQHPVIFELLKLHAAMDVAAVLHGFLLALEGLVLNQLQAVAVIYERVAGNARGLVIWLGKPAIYDQSLAARACRLSPSVVRTGVWPLMMRDLSGSSPNSRIILSHVSAPLANS